MRVVVVGGSAAGLFAALLLARAGLDVVVVDRDPIEPAADVESAAAAGFRPAAPHLVQPHALLSRTRNLLVEHLPDLYRDLLAAGVGEAPFSTQLPATLPDRTSWPGDEAFSVLATRRSTFDWVLRRAVAAAPGVTVRTGVRATGLTARAGDPPRVTGVSTDAGDLTADLVVDASGRRSAIDRWLAALDAAPTRVERAECGLAYYSRHYRLRDGATPPGPPTTRTVAGLPEFTTGIWGADNGTMQVAVAPLVEDTRFRAVADPAVFTAVVRTVPFLVPWLDVLDPITGVHPMGGLHNTLRRLVDDGRPVAHGLHALGDSVCTTNPTLGRGLALALLGAVDLVAALTEHADRPGDLARALQEAADEHVAPVYADQAGIDAARLVSLRHTLRGTPAPPPVTQPDRVTMADLRLAAPHDPVVFRAYWRQLNLLTPAEEIYTDPDVVARTRAVSTSAPPPAGPTRERLEAALAG